MTDSIQARKLRGPGRSGHAGRLLTHLAVAGLVLQLAAAGGCTRRFFRRRADEQVDALMIEKNKYPLWKLDNFHVYPDPRSRFADWTNPDRPPMPPDDIAANDMSPHPQNPKHVGVAWIEGYGYLKLMAEWDRCNRETRAARDAGRRASPGDPFPPSEEDKTPEEKARWINAQIESELARPMARDRALPEREPAHPLPRPFLLNMEQTVELGFLCSRDFQTIREDLYLIALAVTQERFAFIAQPFVAEQIIRTRGGSQTGGGATGTGTTGTTGTGTTGTGTTGTTGTTGAGATTGAAAGAATGARTTGSGINNWAFNTTAGFTKYFSTGALALLSFANQTVYNLGAGPVGTVSVSNLNFDFVQPFLAGGGRAVALEPLTQVERNLVYAIRDFYRFRQEFFVFFAAGQPAFIPGVQPGVQAIAPASITTPGAFIPGAVALPTVSNPANVQVPIGTGVRLVPTPGIGPTPQGFLSTIGERANLVNTYKNIQALERFLARFRKYLDGGTVNAVQVGQIEQTLLRSREGALTSQVGYRVSLDQLKQQLGIPMTISLELDDSPLRPMTDQIERYESVSVGFEGAVSLAETYGSFREVPQVRPRLHRLFTTTPLVRDTRFRQQIARRWGGWERLAGPAQDTNSPINRRLEQLINEYQRLRQRMDQKRSMEQPITEGEQRRTNELEFEIDLGTFERNLRLYERQAWNEKGPKGQYKLESPLARQQSQARQYRLILRGVQAILEEPFRERVDAIQERWAPLPPLCVNGVDLWSADEDAALAAVTQAGLSNRLDLMNQRAQVVDSWRKIKVAANALLGVFTVDYHVGTTTPAGQARPFAFGDGRTTNQLIMNGQLPLVRIIQRNNYRSTLIAYQQERRQLMLNEDNVVFEARLDLRNLRQAGVNYQTIQKRNIQLAYLQVDQALQAFSQPQAPAAQPGGSGQLIQPTPAPLPPGATAVPPTALIGPIASAPQAGDPAALTQQLLNTQNFLLNAQNDLYSTWIGILTNRMFLYRDLGLMPLDSRGVWIDDIASACDCNAPAPPGATVPGPQRPTELPPGGDESYERLPPPRVLPTPESTPLESRR